MIYIPLTPLGAFIWKTCRVTMNERELRALVLLIISILNIAFALIEICFQREMNFETAYQGYWCSFSYLIAGVLGTAASFKPSSKQLLLSALVFSALSVPLSIISFILSLFVGYIRANVGLIVISLLALGSSGLHSFHLHSFLLNMENSRESKVNESLVKASFEEMEGHPDMENIQTKQNRSGSPV